MNNQDNVTRLDISRDEDLKDQRKDSLLKFSEQFRKKFNETSSYILEYNEVDVEDVTFDNSDSKKTKKEHKDKEKSKKKKKV